MLRAILRMIAGILVGIVVALVLLIAVELFSAIVHPTPPGFQHTQEEMCRHVANYPAWVLAAVVPMWGFTAFASVWVAARIGNGIGGFLVGALLMVASAANLAMLPYPLWFIFAVCIVEPPALWIALYLAKRRKPPTELDVPEADGDLEAASLG